MLNLFYNTSNKLFMSNIQLYIKIYIDICIITINLEIKFKLIVV